MAKNIVISGYYGSGNFGDECILNILVEKLKDFDTDITVLSLNPQKTTEENKVKAVNSFNLIQVFSSILKSDILISGGGSLLQDVTSLKSLLYYLFVIFIAEFFHKKVFIFAQGIGPIKNKFAEFLCKKLLKKADIVTVRDDKSLFLLRGWGINNTELVCDPLFALNLIGSNPSNKVGIQLREFSSINEMFLINLANAVNLNFSDKLIEIYSLQDSLDKKICLHFESILKSINPNIKTSIIFDKNPKEIINCISQLDFMIAMRFHACLISAKYGIRTLALSYDYKVEKLAQELNLPVTLIKPDINFNYFINLMRNLDKRQLLESINQKQFSWSKLENLLSTK